VLELAASAVTEMSARRLASSRGRFENPIDDCSCVFLAAFYDPHQERFAGRGERHEYRETLMARDSITTIGQPLRDNFYEVTG
jgi:hypothetical protein